MTQARMTIQQQCMLKRLKSGLTEGCGKGRYNTLHALERRGLICKVRGHWVVTGLGYHAGWTRIEVRV